MITIDQLLESVDLDFEPRFVTKDKNGYIGFWSNKPESGVTAWYHSSEDTIYQAIYKFKLAEFEGKDWTECIYEVPRKTTGKIEKLGQITTINHSTEAAFGMSVHYWLNKIIKKQGELVDVVNELKERTEPKKLTGFAKTLSDLDMLNPMSMN